MQLYLNNNGSKWIDTNKNEMRFVLVLSDGTRKVRHADYYEAFGNFVAIAYRYQGKRFHGLSKASDGSETRLGTEVGNDSLPHVFMSEVL
jgi:hypothetical protein